ncbi:NAD(P)-binding domain-containing protein [Sinirhodobacter huangdaonensis]|uniref:Sulfolactaldehyde 3-reductase n=1 Tax=Paenirhodobacter huangdaonensis TaxID=2501515 RepID=A0A443LDU8_9RHOB|nr:NAD(P)-binding domain-containing protein [Sinirhodobacter huangdaonensis]RWR47367.1 sulfolactaldehyde 3-reductase [Sinirhodobacter huangdaonensis]
MAQIGFIGLGRMGFAMSRNLIDASHSVWVYDINPSAVERIVALGGHAAASAAEAAANRDFVVTMLPNGPDVEETLFGAGGVATALTKDTLFIDMSTIAPDMTDKIARGLSAMNIRMVDAPVGGTSEVAERGDLLILAGGDASDVARAQAVFDAVGRQTIHCGENGTGTRTKIVNNFMSTALNILTAETLAFAEGAGLDVARTVDVLAGTTAGRGFVSGAYQRKVLNHDISPEFGLALAAKDLNLALNYAAGLNIPLPVGAAASQIYAMAKAEGFGVNDWSAALETMRRTAALPRMSFDGQ